MVINIVCPISQGMRLPARTCLHYLLILYLYSKNLVTVIRNTKRCADCVLDITIDQGARGNISIIRENKMFAIFCRQARDVGNAQRSSVRDNAVARTVISPTAIVVQKINHVESKSQ